MYKQLFEHDRRKLIEKGKLSISTLLYNIIDFQNTFLKHFFQIILTRCHCAQDGRKQ